MHVLHVVCVCVSEREGWPGHLCHGVFVETRGRLCGAELRLPVLVSPHSYGSSFFSVAGYYGLTTCNEAPEQVVSAFLSVAAL